MKNILRYIFVTILSIFTITVFILMILYSPTYIYRYIFWNVGDVYDYQKFEQRTIKSADTAFYFKKDLKIEYIESLFTDEIIMSGFDNFDQYMKESKSTALIFIQNDTIIYENYFNGFTRDSYFHSQSVAKAFISVLIGLAIEEGFINNINDPITDYIPELLQRDKRFNKITIKNLLMMRSGIGYNAKYYPGTNLHLPWHDEVLGYYHPNVRKLLLEYIVVASEPGKIFQYNNYNTNLLGLILERATNNNVSTYLEEKIWKQIGTEFDALFTLDSKETEFERMPSGFNARAIDYAKFGKLFMNGGNWLGKQVVSKKWVEESTLEDKTISREYYPSQWNYIKERIYYKYHWWGHANQDSTYNIYIAGNYGQTIYTVPHLNLIIVHHGNSNKYYNESDLWHIEKLIKYDDFNQLIRKKGVSYVIEHFYKKRENNKDYLPFNERMINTIGYRYLTQKKLEDAIKLFLLNIEMFPESSNAYDSLAEAYMIKGENEHAIYNYKKSIEINPANKNAKRMIKKLNRVKNEM